MIVAVAVCPAAPVLVPELAGGAASELDEVRAACDAATAGLAAARPDEVLVVADVPAARAGRWGGDAGGTLAGYGRPVTAGGADLVLPPPLTLGAWLLDRAGWRGRRGYLGVAGDTDRQTCAAAGRDLGEAPRRALLVLAEGSACRDRSSPGYLDPRAVPYDDALAAALASGDVAGLLALDADLAGAVRAAGRAALQVLAAAVGGRPQAARLLAYQAPFGVAYLVASWTCGAAAGPDGHAGSVRVGS